MQYFYLPRLYTLCLFLLCSLLAQNSLAQMGSSCATPEVINAIPFAAAGRSTCTSGDNYNNTMGCANTYLNGKEYVFTYTPTSAFNNCVSISVNGGTEIKGLFVMDDCPNVPAVNCVAQALDASGNIVLSNVQLTVGKKYYIIVSSPSICFPFNLTVTSGVCSSATPPSKCGNATVIPLTFPYTNTATTCASGKDYNQGNQPESTFMSGEDYLYQITPASNICISAGLTGTQNNVGIFIYNACPTDPKAVCIAFRTTTAANPTIPYVALGAGRTYYILVSTLGSATPCTPFTLNVNTVACGGMGSTCFNPHNIPSLPFTQGGLTTCNSKLDYTRLMLCNGNNAGTGDDYVFTYTSPNTECVLIRITGFFSSGGLYVLSGCPNEAGTTCIAKSENAGTGAPGLTVTMTAGTTYYIVVTRSWWCGAFGIDMRAIPANQPGVTCANPYVVSTLPFSRTNLSTACMGNEYTSASACGTVYMNGEDMVFSYNSPGSETIGLKLKNTTAQRIGVFVLNGCPDVPGTSCVAMRTVTAGNPTICTATLTTPGTYYIVVDTDPTGLSWSPGSSFSNFDMEITRNSAGATCANPYIISALPFSLTGMSTSCYGNDYNSTMACNSTYMNGEDFVFRYDATGPECLDIKLSNTGSYTGLFVLDGCPNAPGTTCIAQTNCTWACAGGLNIMTTIPSAGDYYIIVDGNGWYVTPFDISIKSGNTSPPVANFKADVPDPCVGHTVTFSDQTVPCALSWTWSFPGGNPSSSTACCPQVTYSTSGKYTVTLTSCNAFGCNTITKTNYITVK